MGQAEIYNFLANHKGISFTQTEIRRYLNLPKDKDIGKFLKILHDFNFIKFVMARKGRFQYSVKDDWENWLVYDKNVQHIKYFVVFVQNMKNAMEMIKYENKNNNRNWNN